MRNLALVLDLQSSIAGIGNSVFRVSQPKQLHHYTELPAILGILKGRALWARPLSAQRDQSELTHGIHWVNEAIQTRIRQGVGEFTEQVLRLIPDLFEVRKAWTFIVCFCDDSESAFHYREYGRFRVTFPFPSDPRDSVSPSDPKSQLWYQPIIYDHTLQQLIVVNAINAVVGAIARNTSGRPEGVATTWMANDCARNASQLLLNLLFGFKDVRYKPEREWRLVCCPSAALANSAPKMADEAFMVWILRDPHRVELRLRRRIPYFGSLLQSHVPICRIRQNPHNFDPQLQRELKAALTKSGFTDIPLT